MICSECGGKDGWHVGPCSIAAEEWNRFKASLTPQEKQAIQQECDRRWPNGSPAVVDIALGTYGDKQS